MVNQTASAQQMREGSHREGGWDEDMVTTRTLP